LIFDSFKDDIEVPIALLRLTGPEPNASSFS
jgi:hypothetical protein